MNNEKQTFMESLRNNKYKVFTFLLIFILLLIVIFSVLISILEEESINKSEAKRLCSIIETVPAWVNVDGEIRYGIIGNISPELVSELLISKKIKLVCHSDSDICKRQIQYFGGYWKDYVNSRLTINCKEVMV